MKRCGKSCEVTRLPKSRGVVHIIFHRPVPSHHQRVVSRRHKDNPAQHKDTEVGKTQVSSINTQDTKRVCGPGITGKCWICSCCSGCNGEMWETHTRPGRSTLPPYQSLGSHRWIWKTNLATSSPQHRQPGQNVSTAAANTSAWKMPVGAQTADSAEFMNHSATRRECRQSTCVSQAGVAAVINNC